MNTQDEKAGNSVSGLSWCGFDQIHLNDDANEVLVTMGSPEKWDKAHLRRLRQSADLPGLVPVIDSDFASNGTPFAVVPVVESPSLVDRIPPSGSEWQECAGITEAAARATHEAHLRGLFHGSLSPDQIQVIDGDVAVSGVGLGLGGTPSAEYAHWVAPEVLDGSDPTERSDVYSLGKILEASLGSSLDDVPRSVRRLIMWSSSDTPEARPPSALEFASILAEALGDDRSTFSPAFIPTAATNNLASTASEAVANFVPSSDTSSGAAAAATGAVLAGGAAVAAASVLGNDDPPEGLTEVVEEVGTDDDGDADVADSVEEDADDLVEEAEEGQDVEDDTSDAEAAAVATGELPEDAAEMATATAEISDADVDQAVADSSSSVFDSRQYAEEIQQAGDDEDWESPAAARTLDLDESYVGDRKSNKAGIIVGAILAGVLGVVAFQLFQSDDSATEAATESSVDDTGAADDEVASPSTTEADETQSSVEEDATPATTEAEESATTEAEEPATTEAADAAAASSEEPATTATTEAPTTEATTTTTEATTTTTEATTTTTEATTTTTEAPADEVEVAAPAATVDGPISSEDAAVQVLHGIPGAEVDVYVDGQALAPGFTLGTIAGPAQLDPGSYDIALYAASDSAPTAAADRSDEPLISQSMTVGDEPTTIVAHLNGDGEPTLSAFAENLASADPASGRIELRHLAAAPGVVATVDGTEVGNILEPGKTATVELAAGEHTIETATADGTPVKSATINLADGEFASISVIGSATDGTIDVVVQRYTGLASAPAAVPTGDSDLLGAGEDPTAFYILGALTSLMAAAGGLVMMRRNRRVL